MLELEDVIVERLLSAGFPGPNTKTRKQIRKEISVYRYVCSSLF